ncbi:MAG: CoA-binding protein [Alphaproteobacteria bacterium]|nr:CoA-binding protein [Alphaproteobacteria bacterium]
MVATVAESRELLRGARRIAVLGIKPETRAARAAHYIPEYLASVGYEILPVPVYYPDVTAILGRPVVRRVVDVPGPIDILSVFRRPEDQAQHLDDILAARPGVVWFQSGFMDRATAAAIEAAGIPVVHACIGCRRAEIDPPLAPLEGQR